MNHIRIIFVWITACTMLLSLTAPADALWFFGDKDKKTEESVETEANHPPPVEADRDKCDVYRQKVANMRDTNLVFREMTRPRQYFIKQKYRKCLGKFREDERQYLKHVELSKPAPQPQLPDIDKAPIEEGTSL